MDVATHLLTGFLAAFIGSILPGMLNMTAVSITLNRGLRSGVYYSSGAASGICIHVRMALVFAGYLHTHPEVFLLLREIAILIFVVLAIAFFRRSLQPPELSGSRRGGGAYGTGLFLSGINALALPYFFGVGSFLQNRGWLFPRQPYITLFVIGSLFGAFALFLLYGLFAQYITRNVNFLARHLNLFLAGLFTLLAVVQIVQLAVE